MEELIPSMFYLSQNFPNPFKDSTKIKYCLPVRTKVNFTVFSSDGKKLKELVNKIKEAGTFEIKLDNSNMPTGNYYYRILAVDPQISTRQSFVEKKEMILKNT